jgi:hypothetical protein
MITIHIIYKMEMLGLKRRFFVERVLYQKVRNSPYESVKPKTT